MSAKPRRVLARGAGWVAILREPATADERALTFRESVLSPDVAYRLLQPRIGHEACEVMVVLALDGRMRVLGMHEVARGGRNALSVSPSDVFRAPVALGAAGIVLAHNHPSGDPRPSPEDVVCTRHVAAAGKVLGIPLLDHVIVGDYWHSLREECEL